MCAWKYIYMRIAYTYVVLICRSIHEAEPHNGHRPATKTSHGRILGGGSWGTTGPNWNSSCSTGATETFHVSFLVLMIFTHFVFVCFWSKEINSWYIRHAWTRIST